MQQLTAALGDIQRVARLGSADIDRAERELTRLTDAAGPALSIIRLLHDSQGLAFESSQHSSRMPGFLFDMNKFFQRLISRFLHDHLTGTRIADEKPIRDVLVYAPDGNPRQRKVPAPRPDYALFRGKELRALLDAKYRDIWEKNLPAEWLYQLSIYALASPNGVSVLLYASMAAEARDEQVDVRQPVDGVNAISASVIVRPVPLPYLAELLNPNRFEAMATKRRQLATDLVGLTIRKPGALAA